MNKLILTFAAATALAGGTAFAQDGGAECQAGSAYGTPAGCGGGPQYNGVPAQQGNSGYVWDNSGFQGYNNSWPYVLGVPQARMVLPDGRVVRQSRRDADGDGVTNRWDRFPNDPRRY